MRHRRQSVTFTVDQLALLLAEMQTTGDDLSGCVKRCVSQSLAHHRGGSDYVGLLKVARKMRGDEE